MRLKFDDSSSARGLPAQPTSTIISSSTAAASSHQFTGRHIDATRFGATPDDSTDDTLGLRQALGNCSADGGRVFIPAGDYIVSKDPL